MPIQHSMRVPQTLRSAEVVTKLQVRARREALD